MKDSGRISTRSNVGVTRKSSTIFDKVLYNQWIGYHSATPNWTKASSYTVSASGTVSTEGVSYSISISYTQGVSTKIPANSTKFSRLSIRTDVRVTRTKWEVYRYGRLESTYYVNNSYVNSRYVVVKYQ